MPFTFIAAMAMSSAQIASPSASRSVSRQCLESSPIRNDAWADILAGITPQSRGLNLGRAPKFTNNSEEGNGMRHICDRTAHAVPRAVSVLVFLLVSAGSAAGFSVQADARGSPAGRLMAQAAPVPTTPGASSPAPQTPSQQAPGGGPADQVEAKISELHKQLHITPAQEPQFKAYADVMRSNAQAMQDLFQRRAESADTSAVGELRWYAQLTAAHAEAVSKLVPVFEALYQSMSDKQKKAADTVFQALRQRRAARRAG